MPINDERREIAARLRHCDVCASGVSKRYTHAFSGSFKGCMLIGGSEQQVRESLEWLADLIEPEPERTCRVVPMDAAGNPPYMKGDWILNAISDGCSECGYPFDSLNRGIPNYCSNCGAKVVE